MPHTPTPSDGSGRPVQASDRLPRTSLMMGWWALVSAMFYIYIAALVASAVGFVDAVIGLVLTVVLFGLINKVLSSYAIETGLGVEEISRVVFGRVGSVLATAVLAATALYYGVFEGSVIAATFEAWTRDSLGWSINVWYLVVVLYSTPLVFGGVRNWLDRFNGVLLPLYAVGLIAAVVIAAKEGSPEGWTTFGGDPSIPLSAGGPGWLMAVAIYMGVWVLMMYTVDFARMGRPKDKAFHGTVTFGWVFYSLTFLANGLIGIFLSHALREYTGAAVSEGGVAVALVEVMGIGAVILVWVSQTRINTANYFLASSNLEALGRTLLGVHLPRAFWVVVGSIVMYLMMLTDVFSYLLTALSWQGVLITGWVAIVITHILLDRRARVAPTETDGVSLLSGPGVLAWVVASAIGLVILEAAPAWATTWGPIATAALAAGGYATLRLGSTGARTPEARAQDVVTRAD